MADDDLAPPVDLDRYFERIGTSRPSRPTAEALRAIHRAHVATIPFENLDIHLGRPIRIDLPSVFEKLVADRRGGYCFEQNTLLRAVLEDAGFPVVPLAARVLIGDPTRVAPRTHMLLLVEADGTRWVVDGGFGAAGPLEPVPFVADEPVRQGAWCYRLTRSAGTWTLQLERLGDWLDLYAFTEEPQETIDYEVANHYTSTHPSSGFVRAITVQRTSPELQLVLRGLELTAYRPDGVETVHIADDALLPLLAERFDLHFPAGTTFAGPAVLAV